MRENGGVSEHPEGPTVPASSSAPADAPASVEPEQNFKPVLTAAQSKRANQTLKGMIISVLLTVAVAIPVILINPANKAETFRDPVDVADVASQAAADANFVPWAPTLPADDYVNFARWVAGNVDGIKYWEFGVVTSDEKFVWVRQTADSNPSWLATVTENAVPAGTHTVDGTDWELRTKDKSQVLISTIGDSTLVFSSDSGLETLDSMARLAQQEIPKK